MPGRYKAATHATSCLFRLNRTSMSFSDRLLSLRRGPPPDTPPRWTSFGRLRVSTRRPTTTTTTTKQHAAPKCCLLPKRSKERLANGLGWGKIATPTSPVRTPNRRESFRSGPPGYLLYIHSSFFFLVTMAFQVRLVYCMSLYNGFLVLYSHSSLSRSVLCGTDFIFHTYP